MKVGDRARIVQAAGSPLGGGHVAKDPHPEHIGKVGLIIRIEDLVYGLTTPVILLDDGTELWGTQCWWVYEEML